MSRKKLEKFEELKTFENCLQNPLNIKGNWNRQFFKNNNPITVELGCGKGEYVLELAQKYTDKNFIGIDVKGSRLWSACTTAISNKLTNIGFLRIMIERITDYFDKNELSEIWLTFPDPQPKLRNEKRRLTSPEFLEMYKHILKNTGTLHLKTDNENLYYYTLKVLADNNYKILQSTDDLYNSNLLNETLSIKTTYETKYIELGEKIKYIHFKLMQE